MSSLIRRAVRLFAKPVKRPSPRIKAPTHAMLEEIKGYAPLISAYIPYYNLLSDQEKIRFNKRVYFFKASKKFLGLGLDVKPDMAILISAAAVQLTFGLRRYELSYFTNIYVVPDAYPIEEYPGLYIGHVEPGGIYLSWKHFLEGYVNDKDKA